MSLEGEEKPLQNQNFVVGRMKKVAKGLNLLKCWMQHEFGEDLSSRPNFFNVILWKTRSMKILCQFDFSVVLYVNVSHRKCMCTPTFISV